MHRRASYSVVLLLGGLLLAALRLDAQQTPPGEPPAFRSGVQVVLVDVGVVDKDGHPLRGLTPDDFVVTVDGQRRRIVTAEFIDVDAARAKLAGSPDVVPVSTNEGAGVDRLVVFVVDSNTLEVGDARHVTEAAAPFFSRLTAADRSALVSMPVGRTIAFTWAHDRVREALQRTATARAAAAPFEYGSLTEARDIATRGFSALNELALRECSTSALASAGGVAAGPQTPSSGGGQAPPSGGNPPGGSSETPPPTSGGRSGGTVGGGADSCLRQLQSEAQMAWTIARSNSLASITALGQVLETLARVPGDKTIVLISGGWPLDDREEHSILSSVAAQAAAARANLFTIFVPHTMISASRRSFSRTSMSDEQMHSWPLATLASMSGGRSFRATATADWIFDRLARELGGYYRLGVEKNATDVAANRRPMKVQVARSGVTVRARELFDVATYEDRDWAARLASALESPAPATAVGLRLTSYVAADPEDPAYLRLVLVGDASRLQPGEAIMQVLVRDLEGRKISGGERRLGEPDGSGMPVAANIRVSPGRYMVRLAIMDGAGRVGSVDHRVDARPTSLGGIAVTGPMLVQVPADGQGEPRFSLDGPHQGERLALEIGLAGDRAVLESADVVFEIAGSIDGPALLQQTASLGPGSRRDGSLLAHAVADVRVLPPGQYFARAKVNAGAGPLGEVRRAFTVLARAGGAEAESSAATATASPRAAPGAAIRGRVLAAAPRFAVDHVLVPPVLDAFLDRVAARPDAARPGSADLLNRARTAGLAQLNVSDAEAAQTPVAAFLKGLSLLKQGKLDPAGAAFRAAMRASPDFYPAMVYLGACYAAAGNDREAAAIWRTALIKEGETRALHLLLSDALLRQGSGALALQVVTGARARWPEDEGLARRFALAALLAGNYADGLQAIDDLVEQSAADEPSLALALLVLYDSLTNGRPIEGVDQDRARMLRLAAEYRARGGPSMALVDTWLAAAIDKSIPHPPHPK